MEKNNLIESSKTELNARGQHQINSHITDGAIQLKKVSNFRHFDALHGTRELLLVKVVMSSEIKCNCVMLRNDEVHEPREKHEGT